MKEMLIPMDRAGRIVLPKSVREELALKPGDTFHVSVQGAAVTLTPNCEPAAFVRKGRALVFSTGSGATITGLTVAEILDAGRRDREASSLGSLPKKTSAE